MAASERGIYSASTSYAPRRWHAHSGPKRNEFRAPFGCGFGALRRSAFTLIELLAVIAIIGVLAAMIFPAMSGVQRRSTLSKVQAEIRQVETAIESYKAKYGFYPPDNPLNPALNQLYFELTGSEFNTTNQSYNTLDGRVNGLTAPAISTAFGPKVNGFMNVTRDRSGDGPAAQNFIKGFQAGQIGDLSGNATVFLLVGSVPWKDKTTRPVTDATPNPGPYLNPWRYNISNPANNLNSYDLWMDVVISGKTYRISNWSDKPQQF